MSIKGFKRIIKGEKMPDKDDPAYKERYERDVAAGKKFARWACLDKAAAKVQRFANAHRVAFLVIVFGFVILNVAVNIVRLVAVARGGNVPHTAVEVQDSVLSARRGAGTADAVEKEGDVSPWAAFAADSVE